MQLSKSWLLVWVGAAVGLGASLYWDRTRPPGAEVTVTLEWKEAADGAWFDNVARTALKSGDWGGVAVDVGLYRAEGLRPVEIAHRLEQDIHWSTAERGGSLRFRHRDADLARQAVGRFAATFSEKMKPAGESSVPVRDVPWAIILSAVGVGAGLGGGFSVRHYWRKFMGF